MQSSACPPAPIMHSRESHPRTAASQRSEAADAAPRGSRCQPCDNRVRSDPTRPTGGVKRSAATCKARRSTARVSFAHRSRSSASTRGAAGSAPRGPSQPCETVCAQSTQHGLNPMHPSEFTCSSHAAPQSAPEPKRRGAAGSAPRWSQCQPCESVCAQRQLMETGSTPCVSLSLHAAHAQLPKRRAHDFALPLARRANHEPPPYSAAAFHPHAPLQNYPLPLACLPTSANCPCATASSQSQLPTPKSTPVRLRGFGVPYTS